MSLSEKHRRHLRSLGHGLKAVVIVGRGGISESLIAELDGALAHHELIKMKVNAEDRDQRDRIIEDLTGRCDAQLVQRIGNMAVLYRANPGKKSPLPLPA